MNSETISAKLGTAIYLKSRGPFLAAFVSDFKKRWPDESFIDKGKNRNCAFFTIGDFQLVIELRDEPIPQGVTGALLPGTMRHWPTAEGELSPHVAHLKIATTLQSGKQWKPSSPANRLALMRRKDCSITLVLMCLLVPLLLGSFACRRTQFSLPGQLVLSRIGWDHVAYFDGLHYREVKIQRSGNTDFIAVAQIGRDGSTYGISYRSSTQPTDDVGNSVVKLLSNGSTITIFEREHLDILGLAVTPTSLVLLTRAGKNCPSIKWLTYNGKELMEISAPCGATEVGAFTAEKLIIATDQGIQLLRGDKFVPVDLGYSVTWINSNELIYYRDEGQCTWKYAVDSGMKTRIFCGARFGGAASPDSRYIAVRVLTTRYWRDMPELRVVDTRSHRYVPVAQGELPIAIWATRPMDATSTDRSEK